MKREIDPYTGIEVVRHGETLQDAAADPDADAPVRRGPALRDAAEPHAFAGDDAFCSFCGKTRTDAASASLRYPGAHLTPGSTSSPNGDLKAEAHPANGESGRHHSINWGAIA